MPRAHRIILAFKRNNEESSEDEYKKKKTKSVFETTTVPTRLPRVVLVVSFSSCVLLLCLALMAGIVPLSAWGDLSDPPPSAPPSLSDPPPSAPPTRSRSSCTRTLEWDGCRVSCTNIRDEHPGHKAAAYLAEQFENHSECSAWSLVIQNSNFPDNILDRSWLEPPPDKTLPPLRSVELQYTELENIEDGAFSTSPALGGNVTKLNLQNNIIRELRAGTTLGLGNLAEFYFIQIDRTLEMVEREAMHPFTKLEVLQVTSAFTDPEIALNMTGHGQFHYMARLQFSHNTLCRLEHSTFTAVPNLVALNLEFSNIEYFEDSTVFQPMEGRLVELNLRNNALSTMPNGTLEFSGRTVRVYLEDLADQPKCSAPDSQIYKLLTEADMTAECPLVPVTVPSSCRVHTTQAPSTTFSATSTESSSTSTSISSTIQTTDEPLTSTTFISNTTSTSTTTTPTSTSEGTSTTTPTSTPDTTSTSTPTSTPDTTSTSTSTTSTTERTSTSSSTLYTTTTSNSYETSTNTLPITSTSEQTSTTPSTTEDTTLSTGKSTTTSLSPTTVTYSTTTTISLTSLTPTTPESGTLCNVLCSEPPEEPHQERAGDDEDYIQMPDPIEGFAVHETTSDREAPYSTVEVTVGSSQKGAQRTLVYHAEPACVNMTCLKHLSSTVKLSLSRNTTYTFCLLEGGSTAPTRCTALTTRLRWSDQTWIKNGQREEMIGWGLGLLLLCLLVGAATVIFTFQRRPQLLTKLTRRVVEVKGYMRARYTAYVNPRGWRNLPDPEPPRLPNSGYSGWHNSGSQGWPNSGPKITPIREHPPVNLPGRNNVRGVGVGPGPSGVQRGVGVGPGPSGVRGVGLGPGPSGVQWGAGVGPAIYSPCSDRSVHSGSGSNSYVSVLPPTFLNLMRLRVSQRWREMQRQRYMKQVEARRPRIPFNHQSGYGRGPLPPVPCDVRRPSSSVYSVDSRTTLLCHQGSVSDQSSEVPASLLECRRSSFAPTLDSQGSFYAGSDIFSHSSLANSGLPFYLHGGTPDSSSSSTLGSMVDPEGSFCPRGPRGVPVPRTPPPPQPEFLDLQAALLADRNFNRW